MSGPIVPLHSGNNFDFVRLAAALLVLFSHSYPLSGQGYEPLAALTHFNSLGGIGVVTFFAISGYLVTVSLQKSSNIFSFYKKRCLRIYPALLVVTLLAMFVLGPAVTTLSLRDYFASDATYAYLTNASAFDVVFGLPGVFTDNVYKYAVNGSLWTIPMEVNCYIALGIVSLIPIGFRYKITAGFLVVFSVLIYFRMTKSLPPPPLLKQDVYINFPQAQSYFCFALGSLFAAWRDKVSPRYFWAVGVVLFALGVVGLNTQGIRYYGVMSIYVALFAFVMWLALVPKLPEIPKKFGDISYGVYLYAFPIQQLLSYYKVYEHGFVLYTALTVVITVIFALLSWRFVEKPALRLKKC